MSQQLLWTQRWRVGRSTFRPAGELINPSHYGVEVIPDDTTAREFVKAHHYSGSYPAARVRVGLYRRRDLVGVAVFSVPMSAQALKKHCGTTDAVELGRFVLLDDVPGNGETWFLARAFRALTALKPEIKAVLAYSDPVPRTRADGTTVMPGHLGTIYQAHNAVHTGRGAPKTLWLDAEGRALSPRMLAKVRKGDQGHAYGERRLLGAGAPRRQRGETPKQWVARALESGPFRRLRHPGNLAYVWPVGTQRRLTRRALAQHPYPRPSVTSCAA